jgi:ribosomal protein L16 Arg81 hydroxylase
MQQFEFKELIDPISPARFLSHYWEKKHLILTQRPSEKYTNILSLGDIDFLLASLTTPNNAWIKFFKNTREIPLSHFVKENGMLDKNRILDGFYEGNTIILNQLQNRMESVRKICFSLEEFFGHSVGANMYLTPPNAQGFGAHYDSHDVFILQLEGEKVWKIYDSYVEFPISNKDISYDGELGAPIQEVNLQPCDLLYLPRGFVHEACTTQNYSLHLTVGIYALTWIDLIREIASSQTSLRKALPAGLLLNNPLNHKKCFSFLKKLPFDKDTILQSIEILQKKFSEKRIPSFQGHFTTYQTIAEINEDTILKKKDQIKCVTSIKDDQVILNFEKDELRCPDFTEPVLAYILNSPQFTVRSLPGHLSISSKLVLVREMVKKGLLSIV